MYADDSQIFAFYYDANELIAKLSSDLAQLRKWLIEADFNCTPLNQNVCSLVPSVIRVGQLTVVVNNQPVS